MAIQLPVLPINSVSCALKSNAYDLQPTMGGPTQRLARLGDRFTAQANVRTLSLPQAQQLIALLNAGLTNTVILPIPVADVGAPGSPAVQTNQTAMATEITLTGLAYNYTLPYGAFFNISTGGILYLYQTTTDITANASGVATFGFTPMLRVAHQAGDAVNFVTPAVQGFLQGTSNSWVINRFDTVDLNFTVVEGQ